MATKKSTQMVVAPLAPGTNLPVPTTRTDRIVADIVHPKPSRLVRDDNGINVHVKSEFAVRRGVEGRSFTLGPPRVGTLVPTWVDLSNLIIAEDAKTSEKVTDGKKQPKLKVGPSGALALVERNLDWSGNYFAHFGPIRPEYELLEAFTLYDVEVYVQQAIRRRLSLMFRNGYRVTGNNQNKVKYINRRLNQIAYMMKKTWANFMREILTTLSLCSNCFLLKLRQEDASGGIKNEKNGNRLPIAAYVMIPPHSLFPYVEKGKIIKWRRYYNWSIKPWEDYQPEDIIHLTWDRKPSHIFGTPRLQAVRDDIYAIRRLEENIELLFINFLFPLFHVKVGNEKAPAGYMPGGVSEIDHTRKLIETMPKEGVLVTDERVDVKIVGSEGESLDPIPMLGHYKKRIFTGLGVSPMDMGEGDCYDASTETLTESGWKLHTDIDHVIEKIATFNPEANRIEFHIANSKYEGHYVGDVIRFKGRSVDIEVTPHHDMWVRPRSSDSWRKVKAADLYNGLYKNFYLLESAEFEDVDVHERFTLNPLMGQKGRESSGVDCELNDFAELLGHFIAEGSLDTSCAEDGRYRSLLTQNAGLKLEVMKSCLERCGLSWSEQKSKETSKTLVIYGKTLYRWLEESAGKGAHNKRIPSEVATWSKAARQTILASLVAGDGSRSKLEGRTYFCYYTTSVKLADDVQILAMSLGYQARVEQTEQSKDAYGESIFRVHITGGKKSHNYRQLDMSHISKEHYEGDIYCYNVPNHLFVTRRNGKVTIQGNTTNGSTADNVSQALKDSIKYDLDVFTGQLSMEILRDLFAEANFDISIQESIADVTLEFQEIDMDNKVKEENHATNLYNNNGLTHDEFRGAIKRNPLSEEQQGETHHAREVVGLAKTQAALAIKIAKATPKGPAKKKGGGKKGKSGRRASVTKTAAPKKKVSQNQSTPTNQHGTNNSPKKAKSARTESGLYSNLHDSLEAAQMSDDLARWPELSARVIDRFFKDAIQPAGSSYTKQSPNAQHDQLKHQVGQTTDLDTIFDLVGQTVALDPKADGETNERADAVEGDQERNSCPEGSVGSGDSRSE